MNQIETKMFKRGGKLIQLRIVYDGQTYTVFDTSRKVMKSKKYFSMRDVEKDYQFVE